MTDENNEVKTYTAEEVEAMLEEKTAGLKSKVEELLGESKSAKQKAKELEEAKAEAEREQLEKNQEFQTLYESEKKARVEASNALAEMQETIRKRDIKSAADSMAAELTRDSKRAALLSEKLSAMAVFGDDGVSFQRGGVAIDKDAVLQYAREEFDFLVDGSGSTGGGAAGKFGSGAAGVKGNMGGTREERAAAIKARFQLPN